MFVKTALALAGLLSLSVSKIIYAGVNESGGEFGTSNLPGTFGADYQFINQTHVQYFLDKGVNVFRVTFLMVRKDATQFKTRVTSLMSLYCY